MTGFIKLIKEDGSVSVLKKIKTGTRLKWEHYEELFGREVWFRGTRFETFIEFALPNSEGVFDSNCVWAFFARGNDKAPKRNNVLTKMIRVRNRLERPPRSPSVDAIKLGTFRSIASKLKRTFEDNRQDPDVEDPPTTFPFTLPDGRVVPLTWPMANREDGSRIYERPRFRQHWNKMPMTDDTTIGELEESFRNEVIYGEGIVLDNFRFRYYERSRELRLYAR